MQPSRCCAAIAGLLLASSLACSGTTETQPLLVHALPTAPTVPLGSLTVLYSNAVGNQSRIFVWRSDSATTSDLGEGFTPAWSPDHTEIAFAVQDSAGEDIAVMGTDASGLHRVTTDNAFDEDPEWSPDGKAVVYATDPGVPAHRFRLAVAQADGSGAHELVSDPTADLLEPSWSPDGRIIAYVRDSAQTHDRTLWMVNADGTNAHRAGTVTGVYQPEWSPDQQWIAMGLRPGGADRGIAVMKADGSTLPTTVTSPGGWPAWSADGQWLLFVRSDSAGRPALWTVGADGSEVASLNGILANFGDW